MNLIGYITVDYQLIVYGKIVARVIVYMTLLKNLNQYMWRKLHAMFEPDETMKQSFSMRYLTFFFSFMQWDYE